MARCPRCNSCESMWDCSPCKHCAYPDDDTRTLEQVVQDNKDYDEWLKDMECG